ncbi:hypothetical protein SAMD00019534_095820 [Acytostelium subglobosum LB1]|uniref:hypothetical protein n=1 Tax=Acytostelium subglobosum LB1 TaxID=1410327 RepID=UPI000644D5F6|nr:hypothetical protein SAMD00019534_095820 [Acytostelium subglobosum LB1]GAM26407.1 hypothetical protein SAMD00019534_095820 [Acytostelium subglobosum LB1]|eukprot:XP_012750503.1 hypothetical protein SAMD00019534_095820 [Acytostelium subglobosum LB1]
MPTNTLTGVCENNDIASTPVKEDLTSVTGAPLKLVAALCESSLSPYTLQWGFLLTNDMTLYFNPVMVCLTVYGMTWVSPQNTVTTIIISKDTSVYLLCPTCFQPNTNQACSKSTSFKCSCKSGWTGATCDTDINECKTGAAQCTPDQTCINNNGSYTCVCPPNTFLSGDGGCISLKKDPFITNTSSLSEEGGMLTIVGGNFGNDTKMISVNVGSYQCTNVTFLKTNESIICGLSRLDPISYIIFVKVNQTSSNGYYITIRASTPIQDFCTNNNCSGNGLCSQGYCQCLPGFTGSLCERKTSTSDIIPSADIPSMTMVVGNESYTISLVSVDEMLDTDSLYKSINLKQQRWKLSTTYSKWTYQTSLPNGALINSTFEYFKDPLNVTFGRQVIVMDANSLKLSVSISNWTFQSQMSTLTLNIATDASINSSSTCIKSSNTSIMTQRSIVDGRDVIARIKTKVDGSLFIYGMSVPYFSMSALFDPDYSVFLTLDSEKDQCSTKVADEDMWKILTGAIIGGIVVLSIVTAVTVLLIKKYKHEDATKKMHAKISNFTDSNDSGL